MATKTKSSTTSTSAQREMRWQDLMKTVLTTPGVMSTAYRAFHRYSVLNQVLAWGQLAERGIALAPLATFKAWKAKGRQVSKGQKAVWLWMPLSFKKEVDTDQGKVEKRFMMFRLKPLWFAYTQTEAIPGEEQQVPQLADARQWDEETALAALGIKKVPFDMANGNCQGFAREREVAINPMAAHPLKTMFHELAHIILGHTSEKFTSAAFLARDLKELEAESVALLCCDSLGLPGLENSRDYIQSWFKGSEVPDKSIQKIFSAADKILKAGDLTATEEEADVE